MKPKTAADIYRAKQERRERLAKLPIDERIDLIEHLRDEGRALVEARKSLRRNPGSR